MERGDAPSSSRTPRSARSGSSAPASSRRSADGPEARDVEARLVDVEQRRLPPAEPAAERPPPSTPPSARRRRVPAAAARRRRPPPPPAAACLFARRDLPREIPFRAFLLAIPFLGTFSLQISESSPPCCAESNATSMSTPSHSRHDMLFQLLSSLRRRRSFNHANGSTASETDRWMLVQACRSSRRTPRRCKRVQPNDQTGMFDKAYKAPKTLTDEGSGCPFTMLHCCSRRT